MAAVRATPEERAAAIEVYRAHGLAEAHRQSGRPKATLRLWAQQEGLDPRELAGDDAARTDAANATREVRIAEMRSELREGLLATALDMLERTREPHIDYRGKEMTLVTFDQAPADACRNYLVSLAIALDKFRLESGESTARTEIERGPLDQQLKRVSGMRDELAERRPKESDRQAS